MSILQLKISDQKTKSLTRQCFLHGQEVLPLLSKLQNRIFSLQWERDAFVSLENKFISSLIID